MMATVRIGDRELDVKPATLGFLKKKLLPAQEAIDAAGNDAPDRIADLILLYVGHNDGVDRDFILDHVPADPYGTLIALSRAAGQRVPEGEAKSQ